MKQPKKLRAHRAPDQGTTEGERAARHAAIAAAVLARLGDRGPSGGAHDPKRSKAAAQAVAAARMKHVAGRRTGG